MPVAGTPALVWLEGRLRPAAAARIPVWDHAFLYGDSVYETLRTEGGRPMFLAAHMARLWRSARLLGLALPLEAADAERFARIVEAGRRRLGSADVAIRAMITRGDGPITPDPTVAGPPRLLVFLRPWVPRPAAHYERGVRAIVARARRGSPRSIPGQAKTGNFLPHVLAMAEARAAGVDEAIMRSADGPLAEGATSNLFWWEGPRLVTPHRSTGILPGITRQEVLRLAARARIPVRLVRARPSRLQRADEAFLTSSTAGLVPLVGVDGRRLGSGRPGPRTRALAARYDAHVARRSRSGA